MAFAQVVCLYYKLVGKQNVMIVMLGIGRSMLGGKGGSVSVLHFKVKRFKIFSEDDLLSTVDMLR